ncbi:MAG: DUF3597 domain-containing protein [Xanthobacteraceae bacterium]
MSIFGKIASAIFGHKSAEQSGSQASRAGAPGAAPAAPGSTVAAGSAPAAPGSTGTSTSSQPISHAEVEAMIQRIANDTGRQSYNWRQSIVDLMKLLDLDSSLSARKELAQELGYKDALNGSAEMNIWLHQQVMTRLMASGGKVPSELHHS